MTLTESTPMKTFDELWAELSEKAQTRPAGSGTVQALDAGVHAIGKKLIEEAADLRSADLRHVLDAPDRLTDFFDPLDHHTSFTYYPTGQVHTSTAWLDEWLRRFEQQAAPLGGRDVELLGLPKQAIIIPVALHRIIVTLNIARTIDTALGVGPTMIAGVSLVTLSILLVLPVTAEVTALTREDLALALDELLLRGRDLPSRRR